MAAIFVDGSRQNVQSLVRTFQVSFHLAEGFQRRRLKCEKLTDNRLYTTNDERKVMAKVHAAFGKMS